MTSDEALAVMRLDVPRRLDGEVFAALERVLADRGGERLVRSGAVLRS